MKTASGLLFIVVTLLNLCGQVTGNHMLILVSKPLLMPSLAICIFLYLKRFSIRTSRWITLPAALLSACVGDVLLMFHGPGFFLADMGAFLVGFIFYYCTLPAPWRGLTGLEKMFSAILLAILLCCTVSCSSLFRIPGLMKVCVTAYSCAFAFLIHASITAAIRKKSLLYLATAFAFVLFAFSDSLVAAEHFSDFRLPFHGFWIMATYIDAELLAAAALALQERKEKDSEFGLRLQRLDSLRSAVSRHENDLFEAFDSDFGKGEFETYTTETGFIYNSIRHIRRHLRAWMESRAARTPLVLWPAQSRVFPEPYGKVLIIGPYNYPLHLAIAPLAAALSAGNTAVIKTSRQTPAVSKVISTMLEETFSSDVVEVVPDDVSNEDLLSRRFDYIFFTGSPRVGRIVMEAASRHLTPVTLELGGKSPAIVCAGANVRLACERIAKGKFLNAGQTCVAPDYVLVHRSVHAEFIAEMKAVIGRFFGDVASRPSEMTLMATSRHWERVMGLLPSGNVPGESVVTGGNGDADLRYIAPTVIDGCSWDSASMQEEIFGPVLPVIEYSDLEKDVLLKVREGEKPLALYVFSGNRKEIRRILSEVSFGGGCVNETVMHLGNENIPFGGVGNSGMGAYHGKTGFDTFSHFKSVLFKSSWFNFDLLKPPYGKKLRLIRKVYR